MSGLSNALRALLGVTGDRPHMTGPQMDAELQARYGSRRAAGRALGIPETTLRRWGHGAMPGGKYAERAQRVMRDAAAVPYIDRHQLGVKTEDIQAGRDGKHRKRELTADKLQLTPDAAERVRAAFIRGGGEEAAREYIRCVREPWYREWLARDVAPAPAAPVGGSTGPAAGQRVPAESGPGGGAAGDDSYEGDDEGDDDLSWLHGADAMDPGEIAGEEASGGDVDDTLTGAVVTVMWG